MGKERNLSRWLRFTVVSARDLRLLSEDSDMDRKVSEAIKAILTALWNGFSNVGAESKSRVR